jgi:hypothetical protein
MLVGRVQLSGKFKKFKSSPRENRDRAQTPSLDPDGSFRLSVTRRLNWYKGNDENICIYILRRRQ